MCNNFMPYQGGENQARRRAACQSELAELPFTQFSGTVQQNSSFTALPPAAPMERIRTRVDEAFAEIEPGAILSEAFPPSEYIPDFLCLHIGELMRVEFLISNQIVDRIGLLTEVGANYIVLKSIDGGSTMMCDMPSIRFVTIMQKHCPEIGLALTTQSRISF